MARVSSIRSKLFRKFSLLIITLELVIFLSFFFFYSGVLKKQSREFLNSLSVSLSEWMEGEILYMEDVAFRIAYSSVVFESLSESRKQNSPVLEYYINRDLLDILNVSMGYYRRVMQINLYTLNGKVLRSGYESDILLKDVTAEEWYPQLLEEKKTVTLPYRDRELRRDVIALRMVYFNTRNRPIGVIEILQEYNFIDRKIRSLFNASDRASLEAAFITSGDDVLYPPTGEIRELAAAARETAGLDFRKDVPWFFTREERLVSLVRSEKTGWTTLVTGSTGELHSSLTDFSWTFLVISLLSVLLSLSVSYTIAYRLSYPIDRMNRLIRSETQGIIPDLPEGGMNSGIREVENLYSTLFRMQSRLKVSLDETITAKEEEMNAKILALYSQMNPHFLYNILSIISAMAEENETDGVISVTKELSSMLRYISSGSESHVPLKEEVDHTLSYLRLMKHRYEDNFRYTLHYEEGLRNILIPKLSVQPFIENIFKHGYTVRPPWDMEILITGTPDCWEILISDNGGGFDSGILADLNGRFDRMRLTPEMPLPEVGGMGIINIFIRMKLMFRDRFQLTLKNREEGGAAVRMTIGKEETE